MICENSYWFLKGEDDDARMAALCAECGSKHGGWFWEAGRGYGDYDLSCDMCNKPIYIRDNNDDEIEEETTPTV